MKSFNVEIKLGKPRTPRTQGLVEQANGVVQVRLAKWKIQTGRLDWSNGLPFVSISINNTKHSSTKYTPYELVFGCKMDLKYLSSVDNLIVLNEDGTPYEENSNDVNKDYSEDGGDNEIFNSQDQHSEFNINFELNEVMENILQDVNKNLSHARDKMYDKYNKQKVCIYKVGEKVSLKSPKEDRAPTDEKRLICIVMEVPFDDKYKLGCFGGPLKHLYGQKMLN